MSTRDEVDLNTTCQDEMRQWREKEGVACGDFGDETQTRLAKVRAAGQGLANKRNSVPLPAGSHKTRGVVIGDASPF